MMRQFYCFTLLLLMPVLLWSTPLPLDDLLNQYHSLSADFTQTLTTQNGQLTQTSEGQLYIQKPNRFRLVITSPTAQLFVADGTTLWNEESDLNQVIKSPLTDNLSETPLLLLSGSVEKLTTFFTIQNQNDYTYFLKPKGSDQLIKQVLLTFTKDRVPLSLTLTNTLGDTTELEFKNVRLNPNLPQSLFIFTAQPNEAILSQS